MSDEIEVYVDLTDFLHEIGEGNAPGPHRIYNSLNEIKKKQPCVEECGIVKANLVMVEIVQESNFKKDNKRHSYSFSEKYNLMLKALQDINTGDPEIKKIIENVLKKVMDD